MSIFGNKAKDERVAAETNRIYKAGYYILSCGILADLILQFSGAIPAGLEGSGKTFSLEFWVFMLAQVICIALMVRKGMMDGSAYGEADIFPLGHYLRLSALVGLGTGAVYTLLMYLTNSFWEGITRTMLLAAAGVTFGFMAVLCTVLLLLMYYIVFRMAKRRRARMGDSEDE